MASKRKTKKNQRTVSRSRNELRSLQLKSYGLILGIIAVAVILVVAFVIYGPESGRSTQLPQAEDAAISQDKSLGADNAPVVVVEYGDFQCPFCKQFATTVAPRIKQDFVDTGQVRFVFRNLAFIGPESLRAAEAAECANEQGRFWDYHDKLFQEQAGENTGTFSDANLKRFATEIGLETGQFNQCLDSEDYQTKVQQEIVEANRLRIRSTPSLFVNGQYIENGSSYPVLKAAIEAALGSGS